MAHGSGALTEDELGGRLGTRPGRPPGCQLTALRPPSVPAGEPGAHARPRIPSGRGSRDSTVASADHLDEEGVEFVLERVTRRGRQESPDHEDHGHDQVGGDRQEGASHHNSDHNPPQLDHETIVPLPRPPRYRGATPLGPEIPPEGQAAEPRSGPARARERGAPVRLVIVDDHALVREGTSRLLDQEPDLRVVGTAGSAEEAVDLLGSAQPDVALVDVSLPGRSGLELARWAAENEPDVRVVILSAYDDIAFVDEALNTGVAGYLLKTASGHELADAVRAAADGVFVLDGAISRRLARRARNELRRPSVDLTPREAEVLALVSRGLPNKRIAVELGLGVRTVEGYVSGLLGKLGVASRTEAALYALSHGVLGQDE